MADAPRFQVHTKAGVSYIVEIETDMIVGAFYAVGSRPGWWWGHAYARAQDLHMPAASPLDVAVALLGPTPGRDGAVRGEEVARTLGLPIT
uniref:hypothetical protein n=1 Tax=Actinomadura sp. CA-154981 TaxID=3240037 RepID=UPI003F496A82